MMPNKGKNKILALIPARSGSKSVPHKNIRLLAGKPLLAYSVEHAIASKLINRIIVSTDSPEYAQIARQYGAEAPFLRPAEISGDSSTDLEVFTHALNWLNENESYTPDICVHLRPTCPVRQVADIDEAITILLNDQCLDSVRSISTTLDTPYKMWFRGEDGLLTAAVPTEIKEAHSMPRQSLPQAFLQNACIDTIRASTIIKQKSMTGKQIYGYLMKDNFDIDNESQLQRAEEELLKQKTAPDTPATFCFDIDGVIATIVPGNQYDIAKPRPEVVAAINTLYSQGHRIILWTARGSMTGIDWQDITRQQMKEWGVNYHELKFGKPAADYYIDDKYLPIERLKTLTQEQR